MTDHNELLPKKESFFPDGSGIMLVAHVGIGIFFVIMYFLLHSNIETFKMMILVYYTLFSMFFLFFYYKQLRVRRIYYIWLTIAVMQLVFYFINAHDTNWSKWSFHNVLDSLTGLPLVLILYAIFRRESLKQEGKDLVIGVRQLSEATNWDKAATIGIPLVALLICLF
jgi:hypothetical protein